jgi:spore coat polysaccharide biosynthesis protein SpsF
MRYGVVHQREKLASGNNIGVIVLARYSSNRLPGKALIEIEGKAVLQYILERLEQVFSKVQIAIATSTEASDDPIAAFALASGVKLFRGSLENVADRFYEAAVQQGLDYAIRINGDNIFVDTDLLAQMTKLALQQGYDFLSNVKGRTYPKGMSIEIVKTAHYAKLLDAIKADSHYAEHVTLYLYEHEEAGNYAFVTNDEYPEAVGIQLALDTMDDLERSRRLIKRFTRPHHEYNLPDILELLKT